MGNAYGRTADRCGTRIEQVDGRLTTWWCGSRWCPCCMAIRTARAWASYGDTVRSWGADRWLVTLTVPNASAGALRATVQAMHSRFYDAARAVGRAGHAVQMIRATEVTYNEQRDDYHPHLHVVVRGAAPAAALVDAWLTRWPQARRVAQDARQANEGAVAELFKYCTKLSSDRRNADGSRGVVPAVALDVIFTALRSLRLWQPYGVRAAQADDDAGDDTSDLATEGGTPAISRPGESVGWEWDQRARDWVDPTTGECLTGYSPGPAVSALLDLLERRAVAAECQPPPLPPPSRPTPAPPPRAPT